MLTDNMVKGVEYEIGWRFKEDINTIKDLTGYELLIQIRPRKDSDVVIVEYDKTSTEVTFIPEDGSIDLKIPPSTTTAFSFKKAYMDCWVYNLTDTDGDRSETIELIYDTGVSRVQV